MKTSNKTVPSGEYGGELSAIDLSWALEGTLDNYFRACF